MFRRALHLASILLASMALLYGPAVRAATDAPDASVPAEKTPHVALLLPTGSEAFVRAAEAVRAGFAEASKKATRPLPARLYPVSDDPHSVIAVYRQALAAGAEFVVGPLTRNAVTALASAGDLITVPTLALNVPERTGADVAKLYTLSLQVEAEARQVAQLALSEGRRRALSLSDGSPLARRMRDAFIEEFKRGGGYHIADYAYASDPASLDKLKQVASAGVVDMVFCAIDAQRLKVARPFLSTITAYGTSQLNPGLNRAAGIDMVDVRFVDMPWMVQPDHPAVMVYARSGQRESDDLERLYALGIDAFRLIEDIINGKRDIELDGVTGRLRLGADRQFRRGLLVTLMDGPRLTVLGESRP